MSEREALEQAIKDGVVSADQAEQLRHYLARGGDPLGGQDPENLKFLSSFNDIFLTLGLMILMTGVFIAALVIFMGTPDYALIPVLVGTVVAGVAWALAEYFGRKRRLSLPTMALATVFCFFGGLAFGALLIKMGLGDIKNEFFRAAANGDGAEREIFKLFRAQAISGAYWAQLGAALCALAFYFRFRLPFSLFLLAVIGAMAFYTFLADVAGLETLGGGAMLAAGLATLVAAMTFDAFDPTRATRQSDNAFWLHLAAAPQIMLGLRFMIIGPSIESSSSSAVVMLLALLAVGLLSLALNRRALIFSGLVTFTLVVFSLARQSGLSGFELAMWPLLIVGVSVVLLGAGWGTARRIVLAIIPEHSLLSRLFPSEDLLKGNSKTS
ncbi:MAG: hypothetical protein CME88_11070 [Hirschia sp.]|nr:hypothetical protein [Hirschia sp.]MBF18909.1 hypothetical protein [Hirschia sp.]